MSDDLYVVCDTEVYPNYFLIAFKSLATGKVLTFEKYEDTEGEDATFESVDYDRDMVRKILQRRTLITFNGITFDFPIIAAAQQGAACSKLKYIADCIIQNNLKSWITEKQFDLVIPRSWDHIDLIEVAPQRASLKLYNGRLHGRRMQDLPYAPEDHLTREQMIKVRDYCANDLDATELLFRACEEPITLRAAMGKIWGIDLRSKSDAQVAEALIKERLTRKTGRKPEKPNLGNLYSFSYQVPDFVRFNNDHLQSIVDQLRTHVFTVPYTGKIELPEFLAGHQIRIGDAFYQMGIGGLHSCEGPQSFYATDDVSIVDRDVRSYYPYLIETMDLNPKHLGSNFMEIFSDILATRVKEKNSIKPLKKEGKLKESKTAALNADSLKIAVNGTYGKLGSSYSFLYAPDQMLQTTLSGQLFLLMMIEAVHEQGMRVVSANTDGFVTLVPRSSEKVFAEIVSNWEKMTRLETEETRYKLICNRDVNNYLAIEIDEPDGTPGKVKAKGAFLNPWVDFDKPDYRTAMQKNPESTICLEAIVARIRYGTPVWETIRACKDIRKFVHIRTVNGGSTYGGEYLGKAIRWYYGRSSLGCIAIKKTGNKVARTDGAVPLMEIPERFPDDVNYEYYIEEAISLLSDLSILPVITKKSSLQVAYAACFKEMERCRKAQERKLLKAS